MTSIPHITMIIVVQENEIINCHIGYLCNTVTRIILQGCSLTGCWHSDACGGKCSTKIQLLPSVADSTGTNTFLRPLYGRL